MKKLSRIFSLLLVLSLLPAFAFTATAESEKVEISYLGTWMQSTTDGNYIETFIEEHLGIELKPVASDQAAEQLGILIATDSLPDCMWLYSPDPTDLYYKQEVVRTIPLDMLKEFAPTFVEYYDKYPVLWAQAMLKDSETELVSLPGLSETLTTKLYVYADFYRYDWIKNTGVDLGVNVEKVTDNLYIADKGVTPEKFREMLDAFVNGDPDGNGAKDTIGAAVISRDLVLPGFGLAATEIDVDGQVDMYYATDAYKDMLIYLSGLYSDGLLDQEILTQSRSVAWEKVNNGTAGMWTSSTNALNPWASDRPPLTLIANNPEVEILMVPSLGDENGNFGSQGFQTPQSGWFYVNSNVTDDKKLEKILQFVEFSSFGMNDPEILATLLYAEEGVDWEMVDGQPQILNELAQGEKGTWSYGIEFAECGQVWEWITLLPTFMAGAKYYVEDEGGIWNSHMKTPARFDPLNETDIIAVRAEVQTNVNTVVSDFYSNAIMGTFDVEAQWDEYISDLNAAGYDKLINEIRKMTPYDELIAQFG